MSGYRTVAQLVVEARRQEKRAEAHRQKMSAARAARDIAVAELADQGLTVRAIAALLEAPPAAVTEALKRGRKARRAASDEA